jgi:nucleoid-associated protein YgaU
MAMAVGASMVSAYIQVLGDGGETVTFPFDPQEFTVRKKAEWRATAQPAAKQGAKPQFQGVRSSSTEVKILLDAFAVPPTPPEPVIKILEGAMSPSNDSVDNGDAKPPLVMFGWGTNIVMPQAFIRSLSVAYKRFYMGNPVRAEVTVGLESAPGYPPGTNPTSGGLTTRRSHTMVAGDTLASVAYAEYRDAGRWRALAELNDIDDPMRIPPGTELLVPDPLEVEQFT